MVVDVVDELDKALQPVRHLGVQRLERGPVGAVPEQTGQLVDRLGKLEQRRAAAARLFDQRDDRVDPALVEGEKNGPPAISGFRSAAT